MQEFVCNDALVEVLQVWFNDDSVNLLGKILPTKCCPLGRQRVPASRANGDLRRRGGILRDGGGGARSWDVSKDLRRSVAGTTTLILSRRLDEGFLVHWLYNIVRVYWTSSFPFGSSSFVLSSQLSRKGLPCRHSSSDILDRARGDSDLRRRAGVLRDSVGGVAFARSQYSSGSSRSRYPNRSKCMSDWGTRATHFGDAHVASRNYASGDIHP